VVGANHGGEGTGVMNEGHQRGGGKKRSKRESGKTHLLQNRKGYSFRKSAEIKQGAIHAGKPNRSKKKGDGGKPRTCNDYFSVRGFFSMQGLRSFGGGFCGGEGGRKESGRASVLVKKA